MVKITFLGTADSIPSLDRNTTSILIAKNGENILVDCGEGTQRQFRKAKLNPCKITKILITHWHGDHVLGLPGLLSTLALSGYNKVLEIYGGDGIDEYLNKMFEAFPFRLSYKIKIKKVSVGKFFENDEFYLESEKMDHGIPCLAYNFIEKGHVRIKKEKVKELGSGPHLNDLKLGKDILIKGKKIKSKDCIYKEEDKKISIIMDTKLNPKIVPFVKDANLLICEGTYSVDEEKEAEDHMHLTVTQVAKIAKEANVGKLMIVHIASRYLKNLNGILGEAKEIFKESYLPRDLDFFTV